MSLFYFQNNIISEQFIKLNDLCNKFYDIYEHICAESDRFSSAVMSENEFSDGLRNNFSIISQMAERDRYNIQLLTETLDFIGEKIYCCENKITDFQNSYENIISETTTDAAQNQQNDEQPKQEAAEEQQNEDEQPQQEAAEEQQDTDEQPFVDSIFQEDVLPEEFLMDENTAAGYADSQEFADNVAENIGAVSADYNDTASVLDFGSDKNSEEVQSLSFFSNDDFNNGMLSVFGNSLKNSKSLIISLAVSGLSSVLAGGSFKLFRKNHNDIEL